MHSSSPQAFASDDTSFLQTTCLFHGGAFYYGLVNAVWDVLRTPKNAKKVPEVAVIRA